MPVFTSSVVGWLLAHVRNSAFLMPDKIVQQCVAELLTFASRQHDCDSFGTGKCVPNVRLKHFKDGSSNAISVEWVMVVCPGVFTL